MATAPFHPERSCCTRLENLGVRLGRTTVLKDVNLHVHCGELTVIIGPNGSGKTTLLKAIMGEVDHTGSLTFLPSANPSNPKRPRVGYVPQRLEIDKLMPLTVEDLFGAAGSRWPVWLGIGRKAREETRKALEKVGAGDLIDKRLGHLSCGQLQRVLLALALNPVPELLLLDEPLAGMDRTGIAQFYQAVSELRREMDLSILLVSHDLSASASIADRMVFINGQTIRCDGAPFTVLNEPEVRSVFGLDLETSGLLRAQPCSQGCCPTEGRR